jgi:hypothetical protein
MPRASFALALISLALLEGCSSAPGKENKVYAAGEKAKSGPLTYTVIDTEILPQLGDDPATARTPTNRFYVVKIAVTNSSNADTPIPALTLIDDSGKTYTELGDGSGISDWMGVVRKVKPADTNIGSVAFDAPSQHYQLRLTDELESPAVSIDIPLSFVHEQIGDIKTALDPDLPTTPEAPAKSKK